MSLPAPGMLGNDSDANGDSITALVTALPANGTLTWNPDGSFIYTPSSNFHGSDHFSYQARDALSGSETATVVITVNPVNDAPRASGDSFSMSEDGVLTVTASGVLANDSDVEGDPLTSELFAPAASGAVTLAPDGSFEYLPNGDFHGADSFSYVVGDGSLTSAPATVTITVSSVNDVPIVDAGPNAAVNENDVFSSSGLFDDPDPDTWSVTADYGEGAGEEPLAVVGKSFALDHVYADDGQYSVLVRVTDSAGFSGEDHLIVTVENVPPEVDAGADQSVEKDQEVFFAGSFTDPGSLDTHTIEWSFGDGDAATGSLTPRHTYTDSGVFEVVLTVTDDDGGVGTDRMTVEVTAPPEPPTVPILLSPPDETEIDTGVVALAVANATSPDDAYPLTYVFELTGESGFLLLSDPIEEGVDETFWQPPDLDPDSYQWRARAVDDHGMEGEWSTTFHLTVVEIGYCPSTFVEDFEDAGLDADPAGWVDYKFGPHGFLEDDGFRTAATGDGTVYRSIKAFRATEYGDGAATIWRDYEWTGRFRLPNSFLRGHSFLVYSDVAAGRFYQLNLLALPGKCAGYRLLEGWRDTLEGRTRSAFVPKVREWTRFRIRVESGETETLIQSRFWLEGEAEPFEWMIDAMDVTDPIRSGSIGALAYAKGFELDDVRVEGFSDESGISGDRDGDGVCDDEDNCPAAANPEQEDGDDDGIGDTCDECTAVYSGETVCLDAEPGRVIELAGKARHVRGDGACGEKGYYQLPKNSSLAFETADLPESGRYRLQLLIKGGKGQKHGPIRMEAGGRVYDVQSQWHTCKKGAWYWTEAAIAELSAGVQTIRILSEGKPTIGLEKVRVEQVCREDDLPCPLDELNACLDEGFDPASGLSLWVSHRSGKTGHYIGHDDVCGSGGSYYVTGQSGRLRISVVISEAGRYGLRFVCRVGTPGQKDESLRVIVGGQTFDFDDDDLVNSDNWELGPEVEVDLEAGTQEIEFRSIGSDSVHLEQILLEPKCPQ